MEVNHTINTLKNQVSEYETKEKEREKFVNVSVSRDNLNLGINELCN